MSAEMTPAMERGIEALRNADDCGLDDGVVIRNTLTAVLDVEEMARAIQAADVARLESVRTWDSLPEWSRESYRNDARAIRTAILGTTP